MGHFKHVSAFAYIPGFKAWLIYDVARAGTRLLLLPADESGKAELVRYTRGCAIVTIRRKINPPRIADFRLGTIFGGFFCTTSIAHLLGLTCVALIRPDGLYRHILRHGGVLIDGQQQPSPDPAIAGRPQPCD